jgi:indolepyruvate ferredoxin oxidoreductase
MAAHLEGASASVLDFTGFAQKGGAVLSHVRLARDGSMLHQARIDIGSADALIACDLVVGASRDWLGLVAPGRTRVVANTREIPTGAMLRKADSKVETGLLEELLRRRGAHAYGSIDAHHLAERLVGDAIQANMLLLGFAWQRGLVPVSFAAIDRAIELNGIAVDQNRRAFAWGRLAAADPGFVSHFAGDGHLPARTLEEIVGKRVAFLAAYQNAAYAERYRVRVDETRAAERQALGSETLTEAVAKSLFKLMAYKDEYEVARLYAEGGFAKRIERDFEGPVKLKLHLAPPLLSRPRPGATEPRKIEFGPWMLPLFRVLARLKRLRGTALDPFGYTAERRAERRLIAEYEALIDMLLPRLGSADPAILLELLRLPEKICGFGPVKERAIAAAEARKTELLRALDDPPARRAA